MITAPYYISSEITALELLFPPHGKERSNFKGVIFIVVTNGCATIKIDEQLYNLNRCDMLTLLPSHLVSTESYDNNFSCLTLSFTFDCMADFPYMLHSYISEKMQMLHIVKLTDDELRRLIKLHETILSYHELITHPSNAEIVRSLLFVFTAEVSAIYCDKQLKPTASRLEQLTESFFHQLHENFRTEREAKFYADKLCISPKYLSRVISNVTGQTPSYWISDFTIREIKMLLNSTTRTVTQLSEEFAFPNSSFFARYFKQHTGFSPQEYRIKICILKK